jgi:uncharacterized Fe-S cluster-containing radical SAM superfamily enzyme
MNVLSKYTNGNVTVTILEDGTKIREYEDIPNIIHPESIDVKITNYCDMNCLYCHESSTTKGKHGDLDQLLDVIKDLPAGVELAIGGGNPLSHPDLIPFLEKLKTQGIIANLTVNQGHLKVYQEMLVFLIQNNLIKGLGISIVNNNFKYIKPLLEITNNIVYHLIAGINPFGIVEELVKLGQCKVLILGYKVFGFGINFYNKEVDSNIASWYKNIRSLLGKCTLSFDNLAIEQLNIKRLFTEKGWERFYMGDDFGFTMYIDAVKQEYAPTSRSTDRVSFNSCSLFQYFDRSASFRRLSCA